MTLEEANKYADEMDKLNDEREEFIKKLIRVRCSDKHREFIEWLLTEEDPCNTCGYEEGSIYCKEHCPHEAKIEQEPCEDAISRQAVLDLAKKGVLVSNGNYKSVCKAINELPPVNPQLCQEKWIDEDDNRYICKECEYAHKPQKNPYVLSIDNGKEIEQESKTEGELISKQEVEVLKLISSKYGTATKTGHWIMPVQDDGMSDPIHYQVRCSECGFDLDPQTWYVELHQYGGDKYCPNCGAKMKGDTE